MELVLGLAGYIAMIVADMPSEPTDRANHYFVSVSLPNSEFHLQFLSLSVFSVRDKAVQRRMSPRAPLQRQFSEEVLPRVRPRSSGQSSNRLGNAIPGLSSTTHHRTIVFHATPIGHRDTHDTDAQSESVGARDN